MDSNNAVAEKNQKKLFFNKNLPYILIGVSLVSIMLGGLFFIGPILVIIFAPDLLLFGIALLILRYFFPKGIKLYVRVVIFVFILIVIGLNTRLPSLFHDLFSMKKVESNLSSKLSLSVGDAIHLDSNITKLTVRRLPYAKVEPVCTEGFCVSITGFSPPATFRYEQYWHENPIESIKSLGYSLATSNQQAPTLRIRAKEEGHELNIHQELLDDKGKLVASESRTYRNGFPFESPDLDEKRKGDNQSLWPLEYLLHGSFVSSIIGQAMGRSQTDPVGRFLISSIQRYVQQDDPNITQMLEPIIESDVVMNPPLEYSIFNRAWDEMFNDTSRYNACKAVIQPAIGEKDVSSYYVEGSISGLVKVRKPFKFTHGKNSNERILIRDWESAQTLCDGEFLYLIDRTKNYSQYEISKYKYDGTFVYRVAFKMPLSKGHGFIDKTSLQEINGQLKFRYVDFYNEQKPRIINRIRKMCLVPMQTQ